MSNVLSHAGSRLRRPSASRALLAAAALLAALALVPILAVPARAGGSTAIAGNLHMSLSHIAKFSGRAVGGPAATISGSLDVEADAAGELTASAATAEEQLAKALAELRDMKAIAVLDPHYTAALVATGRAYLAVSGRDPITKSTINPEYLGLEAELEKGTGRIEGLAGAAGKVSVRVKVLSKALLRAKRAAAHLERQALRGGAGGS